MVALLLASPACSDATEELAWDEGACAAFTVPTGFGLRWDTLNHRISRWSVRGEGEGCRAASVAFGYIGGDFSTGEVFSDTPHGRFGFRRVEPDPTQAGAHRVTAALDVGPSSVAETTVTLSRADAGLRGYEHVSAFVAGVAFATDVPQPDDYPTDYEARFGYTSRGLGAWARIVEVTADEIVVSMGVRFAHGTSDRADMNRAIPVAVSAAELDVLVVGSASEPRSGDVTYDHEVPRQQLSEDPPPARAPVDRQRVSLVGAAGAAPGIWGLSEFDVSVVADTACDLDADCPALESCDDGRCTEENGPAGIYVREIAVSATLEAHDREAGTAAFLVDGTVSNASQFIAFFGFDATVSATLTWLPGPVVAAEGVVDMPFETGRISVPLPDDE